MTLFRKTVCISLLLLLCLWLGCQPARTADAHAPSPVPLAPSETPEHRATPAPTAAPTAAPTPEPTPTPAPTPTASPTPTPTPSPTPSPVPAFAAATVDPDLRLKTVLSEESPGLYRNKNTKEYWKFGRFGNGPLGFYPTDPAADPVYGTPPQALTQYILSPYAPEKPPKKDGDRWLTVFLGSQSVVCFIARDGDWAVERVMICSAADDEHQTPPGMHYIYSRYKYKAMTKMNGIMVYAQYACRFRGHYLFHTVPIGGEYRKFQKYGKKQMLIQEYELMGSPASHGCVRLLVGDAYWIYKNCKWGTKVFVTDAVGPTPPPAPALIYAEPYMNADQTLGWDPTDPDPENPYRAIYPEWFE